MKNIFQNLIITGRPACGKSEFIDFMKKTPAEKRATAFHIGNFEEMDDFPWLCELCDSDDAREAKGEARLYTEKVPEGFNVTKPKLRGSLVAKMNEVMTEKYIKKPEFYKNGTLLIEFARGQQDNFHDSLNALTKDILTRSVILHILVSFEESYRKNHARYKKGLEASILSHKVPDKDMYGFFKDNDWLELTGNKPFGYVTLNGVKVPFVTMQNEPELTDVTGLTERYGNALNKLMELYTGGKK